MGDAMLWSGRIKSVTEAATALSELKTSVSRPVIIDIGAGGGWAARLLSWATVIGVDLIPPTAGSDKFVRGDMRHLPLQSRCADAVVFAASLHYAPLEEVISEAGRVLKRGGLMAAVDSPIYRNKPEQFAAITRSEAYYRKSGFPALASHYHPISGEELRRTLDRIGFRVLIWRTGTSLVARLERRLGRPRTSMVVARLT